MDRYAIPSSRRADALGRMTLPLLWKLGVQAEQVEVWVTGDQFEDYRTLGVALRVAPSPPRLMTARNAIARGYPHGTRLIQLDDDCSDLMIGWRGRSLRPVTSTMWDEITGYAWEQCALLGLSLWGTYPVCNDYFMRPFSTTDLRRVSGGIFGQTLRYDEAELLVCDEKEDYERTCRMFLRDGGVFRMNWLALRVAYMTGQGGMQDYRTIDTDAEGARRVCALFPRLTKYVPVRGSRQTTEVDLRRLGGVASPIPMPPALRTLGSSVRSS